jgi:VanZ family protein
MKFFKKWGPVIFWCGLIFVLSCRPSFQVSERQVFNFLFFKTVHVAEYAILYVLWFRTLTFGGSKKDKIRAQKAAYQAFILMVIYAFSDEIHQWFVPTREGRIRDVFVDAVGGLLGWVLIKQYSLNLPPRLRNWVNSLLKV